MKLNELLKMLGNEAILVKDTEQDILIMADANETDGDIWKDREVLKFEKLECEEIFEDESPYYFEITISYKEENKMKFEELKADQVLKAPNGREFYVLAKAPGFVDMAHTASAKKYSFNKDTYEAYFEIK